SRRLRNAKVDHLDEWLLAGVVALRYQYVGRLQIAMNDALLMGMLDRVAHGHEDSEPGARIQLTALAILRDGLAAHEFHDEVRASSVRCPAIEDTGNVRVVHQGQGLLLGPESGNDLTRIHPQLDDLNGHVTSHGSLLLRQIDCAKSAFAYQLDNAVWADSIIG